MLTYIAKRLAATLPVMLIVAFVIFSLLYLTPGDPAAILAGDQASAADLARIRATLGLDRPFLVRFGEWLWNILHGDLGRSITTELPVSTLIDQRLGPTVSLMLVTLVAALLIAIPLGILAAARHGRMTDRTIMLGAVLGFSLPVFAIGYLLIYIFALRLGWLPAQGYTALARGFWPWFSRLILPAATLGAVYVALIARITRASLLEVLSQDYIRAARAKGVSNGNILLRHALKNASVPIATMVGLGITLLIGGSVVTETVFAIPGLGRLTVDSILRRDYPVIQGVVLLFSATYVLVNLLVDLLYTILDPRIRY